MRFEAPDPLTAGGARRTDRSSLALLLLGLGLVGGCSSDGSNVTCGPGTVLVGSQCQVAPVQTVEGGALDAGSDSRAPSDGAVGADGDDATTDGAAGDDASADGPPGDDSVGDDASAGDADASPDAPGEAGPILATCSDGGSPAGDPCPASGAVDCSNSCTGGMACSAIPSGCAWNADPSTSLQLEVVSLTTVRTPSGELDTASCSTTCGEGGADHASWSFAITTGGQWGKFSVPAPWRVVAPDGDICHPADNHCLLSKTGAIVVAPDACMPARNITVEAVSTGATCP